MRVSFRTQCFLAAGVVVAAAVFATVIHFRDGDIRGPLGTPAASVPNDPLARELARCHAIGMAAADDASCEAAWAENRRRFFSGTSSDHAASRPGFDQPPAESPEDR
jgi:conjugative transfer region protein TrbK